MESTRSPLESLAFGLSKAGAAVTLRFAEAVSPSGLKPNLVGLLAAAAADPGAHQADLGRRYGVGPSAVVPLIDELEALGMVVRERDQKDRRRSTVVLTAGGREALAGASEAAAGLDRELKAGLNAAEVQAVERFLDRVLGR